MIKVTIKNKLIKDGWIPLSDINNDENKDMKHAYLGQVKDNLYFMLKRPYSNNTYTTLNRMLGNIKDPEVVDTLFFKRDCEREVEEKRLIQSHLERTNILKDKIGDKILVCEKYKIELPNSIPRVGEVLDIDYDDEYIYIEDVIGNGAYLSIDDVMDNAKITKIKSYKSSFINAVILKIEILKALIKILFSPLNNGNRE